jgi:peptide/nickel transport system permease protein
MGEPGLPLSWEQIQHRILPVMTLSLIPMGIIARLVRATVLEVLSRDLVPSLDARGLHRPTVLRHVAKNAAPAILALMGLQFGYLLGGSILIETVFNWPGVGNLLNLAIFRRDIPVIQATILTLALFFVLINLAVDILQAVIDARMRRT